MVKSVEKKKSSIKKRKSSTLSRKKTTNLSKVQKMKTQKSKVYPSSTERLEISNSRQRLVLIILCILLIIVLSILLLSNFPWKSYDKEKIQGLTSVNFEIEPGEVASGICYRFAALGLVDDPEKMLLALKNRGLTQKIIAGFYNLDYGLEVEDYINIITTQQRETEVTLKIYAGWTLNEIDEKLSSQGFFERNSFIEETELIKEQNKLLFSEGWFQSGSYTVSREEMAKQLAEKMFQATEKILDEYSNEIQKQNIKKEDVIIISSLLEAETHDIEQMKMISGIIRNRLKEQMPLGIDATTRYEKKDWENPLQASDFVSSSSYNTRRNKGLPITGICCPSSEALKATIFFKESPYFYYRHDSDGNIHYNLTYSDHLESGQTNP